MAVYLYFMPKKKGFKEIWSWFSWGGRAQGHLWGGVFWAMLITWIWN